jgi:alpha-glucosidase
LALKVVIDMVANHSSDQHPWFQEALRAGADDPARHRYVFRPGRGDSGELPPNNWVCAFGSSAWTRTAAADGTPGDWYLHTFSPEQPDLNWASPLVQDDMLEVLRFWYGRGIDGMRIDAVPAMWKADGLPDAGYDPADGFDSRGWTDSPHWDHPGIHDVLRRWRAAADEFSPPRMLVVEAVVSSPERLAAYLRPDEAHCAFNFDFLYAGWDAPRVRAAVSDALAAHVAVGAMPTWALGSHDETRVATRFAQADTRAGNKTFDHADGARAALGPAADDVGLSRARAMALVQFGLPGSPCVYQGDELGLPEVLDLPDWALATDPVFGRSDGASRGRAGCRVPLPWDAAEPAFGFSDAAPWLPQPTEWATASIAAQTGDPASTLELFRSALALRRARGLGGSEDFAWSDDGGAVLRFVRGDVEVVANMGEVPVEIDEAAVLISSGPRESGVLPPDAAVWLDSRAAAGPA